MPLTRFKLSAIEDGGIATADLADGAITTAKIADSAVTSVKTSNLFTNTEIAGTEAARMPVGTTAQRANAQSGDIRFNSTLSLMEYYDGAAWKAIDSPPQINSISPTTESDANANIVITGSNFQTGATVKFVGNDNTEYASPSVTRNSSTQITATTPNTALAVSNEPYDVVVTNTNGLSGTLGDGLDAGGVPAFDNSAGSLGTIQDTQRTISGSTLDASATDPDGDSITYSVSAGALSGGLSISSSTGLITGTASAVGSDTTSTFTVSATTASGDTSTRQFSITIAAPVITSYTSTGSGTFSVPNGVSAVNVLVVAGGGGGGAANSTKGTDGGGGGGAGGLIYRPAFPVTPGGTQPYTVGGGGQGNSQWSHSNDGNYQKGQNSVFGSLTALGGGAGQSGPGGPITGSHYQGGSGGGAGNGGGNGNTGGQGIQSQQPGDSGTYGFGNPGGSTPNQTPYNGNGGGGSGGAAGAWSAPASGAAGAGKSYSISGSSVSYAGGGGGAGGGPGAGGGSQGAAGGGNGKPSVDASPLSGTNGGANRGSGGGGGAGLDTASRPWNSGQGGTGGSGIVIVSY